MRHSPIGETHDEVVREEIERNPAFASVYEETRFEGQLALELAEMREYRRVTQTALAQSAGTSQPMINRLERAGQTPTVTTLWRLLRALDAEALIRPDGITICQAGSHLLHPFLLGNFNGGMGAGSNITQVAGTQQYNPYFVYSSVSTGTTPFRDGQESWGEEEGLMAQGITAPNAAGNGVDPILWPAQEALIRSPNSAVRSVARASRPPLNEEMFTLNDSAQRQELAPTRGVKVP